MFKIPPFFLMAGWTLLLALASAAGARADGGWVCLQQTKEPYKITIFANGTPLRAGPLDFSALVQDAKTGKTVTGAEVVFRFSPNFPLEASKDGEWLPPCCRLEANTFEGKAVRGAGGNSLLYENRTSLTQPGNWKMQVSVSGNGQPVLIEGTIQVEKAAAPWFMFWPYLAAPIFGVGFLILNGMARRAAIPAKNLTKALPA